MKSSERVGWEGRPDLNCDFCINCKIYGKLENSQKLENLLNQLKSGEIDDFSQFARIWWKLSLAYDLVINVTKDCENRWYSKKLRLNGFKLFFAILANFVNERENSGKSKFTRKFVNLAKNRTFYSEREKLPILQFFLRCVVRVRKIANFFHCVQTFKQSSIGHFVLEHEAGSLLCRIALWDCFGVVIAFFIG